jgi:hypothetical protein
MWKEVAEREQNMVSQKLKKTFQAKRVSTESNVGEGISSVERMMIRF